MNDLHELIKEVLLTEEVFGAQAFVYHGTELDGYQMEDILSHDEFEPGKGSGDMYGRGLYTVYEKNPNSRTFDGTYGRCVVKLKVNLHGFIIFDKEICQKVYGKVMTPAEQLDMLGLHDIAQRAKDALWIKNHDPILQILNDMQTKDDPTGIFTSGEADTLSYILSKHVKGIVFTGRQDGKVVVIYDPSIVVPVSWRNVDWDWNDWHLVGRPGQKRALHRSATGDFTPGRFNSEDVNM